MIHRIGVLVSRLELPLHNITAIVSSQMDKTAENQIRLQGFMTVYEA